MLYLSRSVSLPSSPCSLCFADLAWISPLFCSLYNSEITILFSHSLFTGRIPLTPCSASHLSDHSLFLHLTQSLCVLFFRPQQVSISINVLLMFYAWKIKAFYKCALTLWAFSKSACTSRELLSDRSDHMSLGFFHSSVESLASASFLLTSVWSVALQNIRVCF